MVKKSKVFKNKVEFSGIGVKDDDNAYNDSFSLEGSLSITPDVVLKTGYMTFNDRMDYGVDHEDKQDVKDIDYAITLGFDYGFIAVDTLIKLAVEYSWMNAKLDRVENYENFMATFTLPF